MVTWRELVTEAEARFERLGVPEPGLSARWIGRQATGSDAAEWLELLNTTAGQGATQRQVASFDRMVERRCTGEPLQYVIGSWGFRTLDLFVDSRVLIPRPETETVAERALGEIDRVKVATPDAPAVDLGTGSGAIGLSIVVERPGIEVWLTDASADALQVARANLAGTGRAGGSVRLAQGDWFDALPAELAGRVGVVVSNPPYVASADDLEPQVARWEPMSALVADADGAAHLIHLIDTASTWLLDEGALVLEMAPDQVDPMIDRARARFGDVEPIVDLAGRNRGLVARIPRR